ncbi:MAG: hypothetical protein EOP04_04120 [Proteobacteria bacterium]|nr:MAG: hypothetical protein EOP04_04120 [Pseudomonadota bacterium]
MSRPMAYYRDIAVTSYYNFPLLSIKALITLAVANRSSLQVKPASLSVVIAFVKLALDRETAIVKGCVDRVQHRFAEPNLKALMRFRIRVTKDV